ncbi:MAG: EAL domain-containing protein [Acidimicrobiia bacterium]
MLEHATDGICLVDRAGIFLAATPAIGRMLGTSADSLIGTNGLDWLNPDDIPDAVAALMGALEPAPEFRGYRFRRADGDEITVEVLSAEVGPLPEAPDGALVLTVREVTEFHHAREELERSQARRALVAQIAAGFVDALDDELDAAVEGALERFCAHAGADRAYVFRVGADLDGMRRTHGWARPPYGFADGSDRLVPTEMFPAWRDMLRTQQLIVVDDVDAMDESWAREHASMKQIGLGAIVAVPVLREGTPTGFLALDVFGRPHQWSPDDVALLRVATDVIGSALARQDAAHTSRVAEARFRTLMQTSGDALIVIDEHAVINHPPIGRQLFGYTPDELHGMNALDLVHPDDLEFAATEMIKAVTDPDYQATNAMRIRHADGHWVPIELVARSYLSDPDINGVVMNVRDHTERDAFASALRISEERHRTLIANLPGAVFRCSATPPYTDEFVSDAVEELTGYTAREFLDGDVVYDDLILSDHQRRTDSELEESIADGRAFVIEYPIRHRDGSVRWISEHGRVLSDERGEPSHLEGFMFDISSRVEAVNEGRETESKLANLIDNVPGVVFRCEPEPPYRTIFLSDAVEDLTGYPVDGFGTDRELYDLVAVEHRARIDAKIRAQTALGESYVVEYEIEHRDGSRRWVEERGQAQRRLDGTVQWLDGVMMDLTDRKELEHRLAHDAAHDPLTGLPNRTLLLDHLDVTLARGQRGGTLTAVLFVDLDRFKLVNDAMGHTAGDELLIHFTRRLSSVLRDSDVAARTGGDEFVIVCTDLADHDEAKGIARRVADMLSDPFTVQGRTVFVTASVGIAFAEPGAKAGDVLRSADAAAYCAKDRGRNRYEVFDEALRAATTAALEVETDLHRALERHELFLRYQPVVDLDTRELLGAEALVRWSHPTRGLLTPDQFLPAAEASGLVVALGREVLDLATGALTNVGRDVLPSVAVNLSPRELAQRDIVERIRDVIAERGLERHRLCIEITENAVLDELETTVATLEAIRDLGVRLAIDDFGTGYSSLSYLRRLPVDTVKIDRSFTTELDHENANVTIVAGIIGLARGLGLDVIAEGVETEEQAAVLRELGCRQAQGYLFSAPVAIDGLLRLGRRHAAAHDVRH